MMSAILGKTVLQTISLLRESTYMQSGPGIDLKKFQECILGSRARANMSEHKAMIQMCVRSIKKKSQDLHLTLLEKQECIMIIAHLSMFFENIDSVHPFVIRYIEDAKSVFDKCIGYITLILLNQTSQSSAYLAVNTLLKDVSNRHASVVCVALTATSFIIDVDLIPVFLPSLEKQLRNPNSRVRNKTLIVIHRMYQIAPEYLVSIWDQLLGALCDKDPHIMSGCLPLLALVLKSSKAKEEIRIHEKVIFILKQVEQGCLPIDMMYRGVSAPWVQIRIFQIIRNIPVEHFSETNILQLNDIIRNIFLRFQAANYMQYAIVSECISTIVSFYPRFENLVNHATDLLEKFLNSNKIDLLVTGVELLSILVNIKPGCSRKYAEILLSCLSENDHTLIKLSLQLIGDLTCADNSSYIIKIMLDKLKSVYNFGFKKEILFSLLKVLHKYPMDAKWVLQNYLMLLEILEDDLDSSIIKKLMRCMLSISNDSLCNEPKRLASLLTNNFTPLQYCMMLELIGFCNEKLSVKECEKIVEDVLDNCCLNKWSRKNLEMILMVSWNVIFTLVIKHNLTLTDADLMKSHCFDCCINLELKYAETKSFLRNIKVTKHLVPDEIEEAMHCEIDSTLSFLNDFTAVNDVNEDDSTVEACESSNPYSIAMKPAFKKTEFKYKPYSQSRFEKHKTLTNDQTMETKKVFLNDETSLQYVKKVWDQNNYLLDQKDVVNINGEVRKKSE